MKNLENLLEGVLSNVDAQITKSVELEFNLTKELSWIKKLKPEDMPKFEETYCVIMSQIFTVQSRHELSAEDWTIFVNFLKVTHKLQRLFCTNYLDTEEPEDREYDIVPDGDKSDISKVIDTMLKNNPRDRRMNELSSNSYKDFFADEEYYYSLMGTGVDKKFFNMIMAALKSVGFEFDNFKNLGKYLK